MSPEQAEMSGLDVDTRTDVYSLGVMLYELLVGARPLEPWQVAVALRESEPPTPSARFSTLGDKQKWIAAHRRTSPGSRRTALRGDLDWIVMRAMEKDRTRRYETVSGLALDIRRHLNHAPVWAGSPSAFYRLRKFVRRHRLGVTAGAAVATGLLGGTVLATAGMVQARKAERVAATVTDFLDDVFKAPDPTTGEGGKLVSVRELMDRGAERLRTELDGQPVIRARLMNTIGNVYGSLGEYQSAADMLEQSLALREHCMSGYHR